MITVLGLDPGTTNFGYSVVQLGVTPFRYNIVEHGMIVNPVKVLSGMEVGEKAVKFKLELARLKRKHKIDFAVAERFMTRGNGGTTIEAVGLMLGLTASVFGTEVCFTTAAVWKNNFNKHYCLKEFYDEMKQYGIVAHRIDALCIGLYGAELASEEPHFQMLRNIKQFKQKILKSR